MLLAQALVRLQPVVPCFDCLFPVNQLPLHVYITLIRADGIWVAAAPQLMINEQLWEAHVLPPHSSNMSFWARHFVSSVKNELLGAVHYAVRLPELPHAYSYTLTLVTRLRCMWVSVSLCIELTYGDSHPVKRTLRDDLITILRRQVNAGRPDSQKRKVSGLV